MQRWCVHDPTKLNLTDKNQVSLAPIFLQQKL